MIRYTLDGKEVKAETAKEGVFDRQIINELVCNLFEQCGYTLSEDEKAKYDTD